MSLPTRPFVYARRVVPYAPFVLNPLILMDTSVPGLTVTVFTIYATCSVDTLARPAKEQDVN